MSEPKVLVIDRATWNRGRISPFSLLLDRDGGMCCLGFDALACGLSSDLIRGYGTPETVVQCSVEQIPPEYLTPRVWLDAANRWYRNTQAVTDAITHNDAIGIGEEERERLIRADLMKLGWDDVQFV